MFNNVGFAAAPRRRRRTYGAIPDEAFWFMNEMESSMNLIWGRDDLCGMEDGEIITDDFFSEDEYEMDNDDPFEDFDADELGDNEYYERF